MTTSTQPQIKINDIKDWSDVPGSDTYFRTSDVTPRISQDELKIYNARGPRRYWGQPSVKSEVSDLTNNVVKVNVIGWHKHTVSPVGGNFYFVREAKGWIRRRANHNAVKAALAA
jgi:hypothetical protein